MRTGPPRWTALRCNKPLIPLMLGVRGTGELGRLPHRIRLVLTGQGHYHLPAARPHRPGGAPDPPSGHNADWFAVTDRTIGMGLNAPVSSLRMVVFTLCQSSRTMNPVSGASRPVDGGAHKRRLLLRHRSRDLDRPRLTGSASASEGPPYGVLDESLGLQIAGYLSGAGIDAKMIGVYGDLGALRYFIRRIDARKLRE